MSRAKNPDRFRVARDEGIRLAREAYDRPHADNVAVAITHLREYARDWAGLSPESQDEPRQGPQLRPVEAA